MTKAGHPLIPAVCYAPVLGLFVAWSAAAGMFQRSAWALYPAGGLALWTLIEYLMHRFLFHFPPASPKLRHIQANLHLKHHDRPDDPAQIVAQPAFSMPIALAIWGTLRLAFGAWGPACLVMAGVIGGYLLYEWVHFAVHMTGDGGPLVRRWRRWHFYHHFRNPARCFGVTTPLWDFLLGTGKK